MSTTIRRWMIATIILLMVSGPVFAGGQSEAEKAGSPGKVEMRLAWWGATGRNEKYLAIIDEYQKQNPNVLITPEYQGWADYWGKMATMVAARNLPDVHQYTNNQLGEFYSKGAVISLESYIQDATIKLDDWNTGMVDSGRLDGKLVGVTIGITAPVMIINMTWAEELGIEIPPFDASFTWKEFADWLKKDVQPKLPAGAYAFGDYGMAENYFWTWVRQHNAEWVDANGNYAVPQSVLEGWYGFIDDLRKAGVAPPLSFTAEDSGKARGDNAFNRRRMLIRPTNANQAKLEQQYMAVEGDKVEMRRLPKQEGAGSARECLITSVLSIAANSKIQDEAAKFINFFINDKTAQTIYNGEIGVPGSYTVQDMLKPNLDFAAAQEFDYINMVSTGSTPTVPKPQGIWAFDAEIQQMNQQVAAGNMTPAQAAKATIDRANKFLASLK